MDATAVERGPSLKERQRREREALILAEAEHLLGERGYAHLVMEELAERVGVAKGTLYLHFPSKEALLWAIVERGMLRMATRLEEVAEDRRQPAPARLRGIMLELLERNEQWLQMISEQARRELLAGMHQQAALQDKRARLIQPVAAVIAQGQAAGEFDPQIAAPVAAAGLFSLLRFSERGLLEERFGLGHEAVVESVLRLYFRGLCARTGGTEVAP